jgi:SAM-dependent methyltransferase
LERFYRKAYDPFKFDTNPYEAAKYDDLLRVAGDGPFARALEVGCSIGSLTERLAPRCEELLAIDISQTAVDRTRERLSGRPNVRVERRRFPEELPDGPFDLIVCSDILYYLHSRRLTRALSLLSGMLAPGGSLVSLHWLGEHGAPTSGDEVHDRQEVMWAGLTHSVCDHRFGVGPHGAGYRLDRFDRDSANVSALPDHQPAAVDRARRA